MYGLEDAANEEVVNQPKLVLDNDDNFQKNLYGLEDADKEVVNQPQLVLDDNDKTLEEEIKAAGERRRAKLAAALTAAAATAATPPVTPLAKAQRDFLTRKMPERYRDY